MHVCLSSNVAQSPGPSFPSRSCLSFIPCNTRLNGPLELSQPRSLNPTTLLRLIFRAHLQPDAFHTSFLKPSRSCLRWTPLQHYHPNPASRLGFFVNRYQVKPRKARHYSICHYDLNDSWRSTLPAASAFIRRSHRLQRLSRHGLKRLGFSPPA